MPSAAANKPLAQTSQSRVFTIKNRAGPANPPVYQDLGRAGAVDWPQGDITPVYVPSSDAYDEFDVALVTRGQAELPSLDIEFRKKQTASDILQIVRDRCALDVQIHSGTCENPTDFDRGWHLIQVLEQAYPESYSTGELGTFDADGNEPVTESLPVTGLNYYEIKQIRGAEQAADEVTDEIVGIVICDRRQCGACGIESDGCQTVFAVAGATTGSPGLAAEVIWTNDGSSWSNSVITSAALSEAPLGIACVGIYVVVISGGSNDRLHYAEAADIVDGDESWSAVSTGFVGSGSPAAIYSADSQHTWIVGGGGYIYFLSDPTAGVDTVQSSGDVTAQALNAVHGLDDQYLVAVGASNAVVFTENGGDTWSSVTGPAVGVALNAVAMITQNEWMVGTAGGELYYTRNKGVTWTLKAFSGSGAGVIRDIKFATRTVGYMAHDTAAGVGRIFRTINGGYSWYALPEGSGTLPTHEYTKAIAACADNPNVVYAGGLKSGSDGVIIKLS